MAVLNLKIKEMPYVKPPLPKGSHEEEKHPYPMDLLVALDDKIIDNNVLVTLPHKPLKRQSKEGLTKVSGVAGEPPAGGPIQVYQLWQVGVPSRVCSRGVEW